MKRVMGLLGAGFILLASAQLLTPYVLPITLNNEKIHSILQAYYGEVHFDSAHLVWHQGALNVLVQGLKSTSTAEPFFVKRLYLEPSLLQSLLLQKIVIANLKMLHASMHFSYKDQAFRAASMSINFNERVPVVLKRLHCKKCSIQFETENATQQFDFRKVHFYSTLGQSAMNATFVSESDPRSWLKIQAKLKDVKPGSLNGTVLIKGSNQHLEAYSSLVKEWEGPFLKGESDFKLWTEFRNGLLTQGILDLHGNALTLGVNEKEYPLLGFIGKFAYQFKDGEYQWIAKNISHTIGSKKVKSQFILSSKDLKDFEWKAAHLDMGLIHFAVQEMPSVKEFFQSFDLMPEGVLSFVRLTFKNRVIQPDSILLQANDLHFRYKNVDIKHLAGKLLYQDGLLKADLYGKNSSFYHPDFYTNSIDVSSYELGARLDLERQRLLIVSMFNLPTGPVEAKLDYFFQEKPVFNLDVKAPLIGVKQVQSLMPVGLMSPSLAHWLQSSLKQGQFEDLNFSYTGELGCNDSTAVTPFQLTATMKNVNLDYSSLWPAFTELNGTLAIDAHQFNLEGFGTIDNGVVESIRANIPDMYALPVALTVQTKLSTQLSTVWQKLYDSQFLTKSTYKKMRLEGQADLDLKLDIPLGVEDPIAVIGKADIADGSWQLQGEAVRTDGVKGTLLFDRKKLSAKNLQGVFRELPFVADLSIDYSKNTELQLDMKSHYVLDETLKNYVRGSIPYTAQLHYEEHKNPEWNLNVDAALSGIEVIAPDTSLHPLPFKKMSLHGSWLKDRFEVESQVDDKVEGFFEIGSQNNTISLTKAHIVIGKMVPSKVEHKKIHIEGTLPEFDWEPFSSWYKTLPVTNVSNDLSFDLLVDTLRTPSLDLSHAACKGVYDSEENLWDLSVMSPELSGQFKLPMAEGKSWQFNLKHLNYMPTTKSGSLDSLPRRPLSVRVGDFKNSALKLKNVKLHLTPSPNGYTIDQLFFETDKTHIQAKGHWAELEGSQPIVIKGIVTSSDLEDAFSLVGKKTSLKEARGKVHFDLNCLGGLDPQFNTLQGSGSLSLEDGYIKGVDPGFGRVLSLLNVDTIKRRLRLDFSDLTKDGFAFDTLKGTFLITDGVVQTDDLSLLASNANIDIKGKMRLMTKQVHADLQVMPNVTGTLPLAAAIAVGNPAVGAAVWLMDKMFGPKIQEMNKYHYAISGTLDNPTIQEGNSLGSQGNLTRR